MTILGVADTHTALWYLFADTRLSGTAERFIRKAADERGKIAISAISLVEIVYLIEKGRFAPSVYEDVVHALAALNMCLWKRLFPRRS